MSALRVVNTQQDDQNDEPETAVDLFDVFWFHYPRKVAKKAARAAWGRIGSGLYPKIVEATVVWARVWRDKDPQFIPHAATFLHGERFEDELPREYKATAQAHKPFAGKPEEFKRGELSPQVRDAIKKALGR